MRSPLRINMNPLLITSHPGKIIDSLLIYLKPRANVNFLIDKSLILVDQFLNNRHGFVLSV